MEPLFGVSHLRQRLIQLQYSIANNYSDIQSLSFVVKFDIFVIREDTHSHIRVRQSFASFIYGILDMVRALAAKAMGLGLIPGGCLDFFYSSKLAYNSGTAILSLSFAINFDTIAINIIIVGDTHIKASQARPLPVFQCPTILYTTLKSCNGSGLACNTKGIN